MDAYLMTVKFTRDTSFNADAVRPEGDVDKSVYWFLLDGDYLTTRMETQINEWIQKAYSGDYDAQMQLNQWVFTNIMLDADRAESGRLTGVR
jgi:hypothetical protein